MALLELLKQQQAPRPMMGRAAFGIQRPSPRVRLDKFKATLDPRMMEQRNVDVTEDVQTPRENIDLSLDVNKDIPLGHDLPGAGGWSRPSGENMTQGEIARSGQPNSESEITNILAEISGIQGKDYGPRKKGGWKDILLGLGLGALQGAANSDPRGGIGAVLGGAIGGGAAGGIGGAVDGSTDNRMRDRVKLDKLYGDYGQASKVADAELNRKYRRTQMENIDKDNAARDAKDKAVLALNRRKAFSQRYKNFDPKNATPAQIRELAEFGETPDSIGKYDFNSRDVKTIGADTYKWDNNANAYVIQGNLHDKSKALTSLTFETPDQEVVTMWVPSTQAATILAQRERTGWQLRQRQELQEDAQNFRLGQKNQPTTNSANYSSPTAPKTGKTTESAARAYLGKKLKGDALENAIKTARANGEIQ